MAYDKQSNFTLSHYLNLTKQRDTNLDQVPFFLGLKNNPMALRKLVEVVVASVNWTVTDVANAGTLNVSTDDVVVLSGHSSTINLPSLTAGRILIVKDKSGTAGSNAITINRNGSDTIDGSNIVFSLNANYGAVIFVGGNGAVWHVIAAV